MTIRDLTLKLSTNTLTTEERTLLHQLLEEKDIKPIIKQANTALEGPVQ